jgi:hypothetical protein
MNLRLYEGLGLGVEVRGLSSGQLSQDQVPSIDHLLVYETIGRMRQTASLSLLLSLLSLYFQQSHNWILSNHLSEWYEPWELCLFTHSNITDPKLLRDWCWHHYLGHPIHQKPTFGQCRIGGARFGRNCATKNRPYSNKIYLQMSWNQELDDPSLRPLNPFGHLLLQLNGTLVTFGDSQMKSFELGLECEIEKGRSVSFHRTNFPLHIAKTTSFLEPNITREKLTDLMTEIYSQFDYLFLIINFGVHYNKRADEAHSYRNSQDDYMKNIEIALPWLNNLVRRVREGEGEGEGEGEENGKRKRRKRLTIVWMETFPQHFNTTNGYYEEEEPKEEEREMVALSSLPPLHVMTPTGAVPVPAPVPSPVAAPVPSPVAVPPVPAVCMRIKNASESLDWRNSLVKKYLKENRLTDLHYLHTREMFLPLVNEHYHEGDCTHYCYSPMLYQPIFQQMHRILVSEVANSKQRKKRGTANHKKKIG